MQDRTKCIILRVKCMGDSTSNINIAVDSLDSMARVDSMAKGDSISMPRLSWVVWQEQLQAWASGSPTIRRHLVSY